MKAKTFISRQEQKILLATLLFSFSLILSSACQLTIKSYNLQVAEAESQRELLANGEEISNSTFCNVGQTYPEVWSRFFSFAFLPLCYLLVRRRKSIYLLMSFALLLFPFFHFLLWFAKTERFAFYRELQVVSWTDKFLYQSNSFDLLLFYLLPILLLGHLWLISRLFLSWLTDKIDLA